MKSNFKKICKYFVDKIFGSMYSYLSLTIQLNISHLFTQS